MTDGYGQSEPSPVPTASREVRYEYSKNLGDLLSHAGITVLISTYQAGKLVVLGAEGGQLELAFHNYDRPMGIAIDQHLNRLAVAARDTIWVANNEVYVARQLPRPAGTCFLTRTAQVTGDIQVHEVAWAGEELWIANTRFSCLCTLDGQHSFVPRWQPRFIDALVAEDRCHLNGLAIENERPKYVTVLAETNIAEGWRPVKYNAGCLIDVESNEVVANGFSMPHSPFVYGGSVFLLNSGMGSLVRVDKTGGMDEVGRFPGYTRGLGIHHDLAFVGLSKIRETATFGGLPISDRTTDLKCGIAIVNVVTGRLEAQFEFKTGIDEIFDVAVVAHPGRVVLHGPHAAEDGHETIWVVPTPRSSV